MTAIVGICDGTTVWMGADSMVTEDGGAICPVTMHKLFTYGEMLIGVCGTVRLTQLVRYSMAVPAHQEGVEVERYLSRDFAAALRECVNEHGYSEGGREVGKSEGFYGELMLGYRGQIYTLGDDFAVTRVNGGFAAIGSGAEISYGALFATAGCGAETRITTAIMAASRYRSDVGGEIALQSIGE